MSLGISNEDLSKFLGVSTKTLARDRKDKILPPIGADAGEIIRCLYELVKNPPNNQNQKEMKLAQETRKLTIANDKAESKLVSKDAIIDYFEEWTTHTRNSIVTSFEKLETDIPVPPEVLPHVQTVIQKGRNSLLTVLATFKAFHV